VATTCFTGMVYRHGIQPATPSLQNTYNNQVELEVKHRFATRWYHWVNFPLLAAMIFSGLMIYWANDPPGYRIGIGSFTLFHFFPDRFYQLTGIADDNGASPLALGMALHFVLAWLFALNGIAYVIYTVASGEWRELVPERKSFREAAQVTLHDMGFKVPMPPQGRYNAAQRISYTAIVVMGGLSLITGLAIYKPAQLHWLTAAVGGYEWARFEHFWLTMGYVAFFVIHIAQVIRAGWANFRSMVTGYDLVKNSKTHEAEADHAE
jgi:thiosulfate reductase cytochrome b subunit